MNNPLDRGRGSDDPLRSAPRWERNGGHAEQPDTTRWLVDPDTPARWIRDLAEENIGPSATSPLGEGPRVEWARVPSLADPDILARDILGHDILDLEVVREPLGEHAAHLAVSPLPYRSPRSL